MALRHSLFEVDIGPVRRSEPRIDSSCCFSTAQESDSRSNVSLATQFFQQPASGVKVQANGTALPTRNVSAAPAGAHNAAVASITRQIENARTYARMASCLRPLQRGLSENHYRNRVPVSCTPPLVALTGN